MSTPKSRSTTKSGIGERRRAALESGDEDYKAKRAAIVRVAAEVFIDKGFQATTLGDIGQRFGMDRASLYYYVGSKGELFREAVQGVTEANLSKGEEILRLDQSARMRLELFAEAILESYELTYPYVHVWLQEDMRQITSESSEWTQRMSRQQRRLQSITMQLVTEGIEEGTFRRDVRSDLAANAFWGMLNWSHRWFKPGRGLSAVEIAHAFAAIFLDGMAVRPTR